MCVFVCVCVCVCMHVCVCVCLYGNQGSDRRPALACSSVRTYGCLRTHVVECVYVYAVYAVLNYWCLRPEGTNVCGLELRMCEALSSSDVGRHCVTQLTGGQYKCHLGYCKGLFKALFQALLSSIKLH